MTYEIGIKYPKAELENIAQWWQNNRQYDVNEVSEPREYVKKTITEIDPETGEEIVIGEEEVLVEREYDDYVEIVRRSDEQITDDLRRRREDECFSYINRGSLWYDTLTEEQRTEFQAWYTAWLNVTETLTVPSKPVWLK